MNFLRTVFGSLKTFDWVLNTIIGILIAISFATIYGIDLSRSGTSIFLPTQTKAVIIGVACLLAAGFTHISVYKSISKPLYLLSFVLLVAVLFFGQNIRGTTGWFRVAGFSFQPAEFAKVSLILFLSSVISYHGRRFDRPRYAIGGALVTVILIGLILLQPDLGSALVLGAIWFGLFCLTVSKRWYIVVVVGLGLAAVALAWNFGLKPYQRERIEAFLHPNDPACAETTCYNVRQSLIAIGSGQLFGKGLGRGTQSQLHFLPEVQTDFIFAVIAEDLGFVGAVVLMILYFLLLFRLVVISRRARDDFSAYVVLGVGLLFFIQIFFNVGAATGLLPVTGLTLPFVSYGGSSLIINLALVGIVQSIVRSSLRTSNLAYS